LPPGSTLAGWPGRDDRQGAEPSQPRQRQPKATAAARAQAHSNASRLVFLLRVVVSPSSVPPPPVILQPHRRCTDHRLELVALHCSNPTYRRLPPPGSRVHSPTRRRRESASEFRSKRSAPHRRDCTTRRPLVDCAGRRSRWSWG
jgi:hypothetical protein